MNSSKGDGGGGRLEKEQSNKRKPTGRPPNKPPLPRPNIPIQIAPRPNCGNGKRHSISSIEDRAAEGSETERTYASPNAPSTFQTTSYVMPSLNTPAPIRNSLPTASGSQTRGHSWQRQGRRPINTIRIAPDERLVEVKFLTAGGEWVVLPKALISPRYPQCFVPAQTAVAIGHWPKDLEGAEIQTYVTPRGYVKSTSAVVLWFELEQLSLPLSLVKLPVLGGDNLGVSIILGSPFIIWCFGSNWPPSNPLHAEEYVSGGWVSHSNYGGYATTGSMEEGADTCRCQGQYQCYCGRSNAG